ncbi:MAG: hypothetical protein GY855_05700 [candidate division Zixibacteria bacterium]|nr:hypothetical protein [candidate division Zixibacteria bacterium]
MSQNDKQLLNIPGGRLSYIKGGSGTIHIQTEFSTYPSLRIVTTVVLEGAVLFKEATEWTKPISTDDESQAAKDVMFAQHQKIHDLAELDKLPGISTQDPSVADEESAEKQVLLNLFDRCSAQNGFHSVTIFDNEGVILNSSCEDENKPSSASASAIATFILLLSERFKSGGFQQAVFKSPSNNICWLSSKIGIIGAEVENLEKGLSELKKAVGPNE